MNRNNRYLPFILLNYDSTIQKWQVTEEAKEILLSFPKGRPLKVIAIVGPMRTGKSYLMNRIAGQQKGFDIGSMVDGCTKGIWAWMVQKSSNSSESDQSYDTILIDTEGMYDPNRRNPTLDQQLFVAAVLLSSLIVYNTIGVINEHDINQLSFVTNLSKVIMVKTGSSTIENFKALKAIFPSFLWVVRDFFLDLSKHYSSRDYLLNSLKDLENDGTIETASSNSIRANIREFFSSLDCMTVSPPGVSVEYLQKIDDLPFDRLSDRFQSDTIAVVEKIKNESTFKKISNPSAGERNQFTVINITLSSFLDFASSICDSFNNDGIPKIESLWDTVSRRTCQDAMNSSKEIFIESVNNIFKLLRASTDEEYLGITFKFNSLVIPFDGQSNEFNHLLHQAQTKCIDTFASTAMGRFYDQIENELLEFVGDGIAKARQKNYDISAEICDRAAQIVLNHLDQRIKNEDFKSFELFSYAQQNAVTAYQIVTANKGEARRDAFYQLTTKVDNLMTQQRLSFTISDHEQEFLNIQKKYVDEMYQAQLERDRIVKESQIQIDEFSGKLSTVHNEKIILEKKLIDFEKDYEEKSKAFDERLTSLRTTHQVELAQKLTEVIKDNEKIQTEQKERFEREIERVKNNSKQLMESLEQSQRNLEKFRHQQSPQPTTIIQEPPDNTAQYLFGFLGIVAKGIFGIL